MTENDLTIGEKSLEITQEALDRSVIERPDVPNSRSPVANTGRGNDIFWFVLQNTDDFYAWGTNLKGRDIQLRNFITREPIFGSALNIVCSRNAGFAWKLSGPVSTVKRVQTILESVNAGKGWHDLIVKTSLDLYTQDNGAFWELVHETEDPDSPVITINHLDAQRCQHTGAPKAPVIYTDKFGRLHLLRDHEVVTFAELPTAKEEFYGLQYCALTRMLMGAQIQRNLAIMENERTAGRETRAIHLVKGITTQQLKDAMTEAQALSTNAGLTRYSQPVVAGTMDPTADVGHDTIELVSYKPSYDEKLNFDHYINLISMAFATDYQDFAPLPGGGLGTGNQSEILHLKSRGKGPGRFMALIANAINFRVVPGNVEFLWDEEDLEAEKGKAEVKAIRAQTRATRIASFEIDPLIARQIANDEGDLEEEFLELMGEQDLTSDVMVGSQSPAGTQTRNRLRKPVTVKRPDPNLATSRTPNPTAARPREPQNQPQ